jgi:hypothetical protein
MSASSCTELKFAKTRPRALDKQARDAKVVTTDKAEDQLVRARAGGQCEVFVVGEGRCGRKAEGQPHHMLGGWGRRARGRSALAEHKQHCCRKHHEQITKHILRLMVVAGELPRYTDVYERWK